MQIEGLTPLQCKIADVLWTLGTVDDCKRWLNTLSPSIYKEALVVMELMIQAAVDEHIEEMEYYPDAVELLDKIKRDFT